MMLSAENKMPSKTASLLADTIMYVKLIRQGCECVVVTAV